MLLLLQTNIMFDIKINQICLQVIGIHINMRITYVYSQNFERFFTELLYKIIQSFVNKLYTNVYLIYRSFYNIDN